LVQIVKLLVWDGHGQFEYRLWKTCRSLKTEKEKKEWMFDVVGSAIKERRQ
jgi:hypothetical protein